MAVFPATIPIDVSSRVDIDFGNTAVEMEDGTPHTQTHFSSLDEQVTFRVVHDNINEADEDTVVDFLRANLGMEFDLNDHSKSPSRLYSGRMTSRGVQRVVSSGALTDLAWDFRGRRTL